MTATSPKMLGVLVTYRRPAMLAVVLARLAAADPAPYRLVVVDNAPTEETTSIARGTGQPWIEYVPASRNLGPSGGRSLGMRRLLEDADDRDWIVLFDDDDPLPDPALLGLLRDAAEAARADDPATAGYGLRGSRFDMTTGRPVPVARGPVVGRAPVDHLSGGFFPLYSVAAVRSTGVFMDDLLFGWEDLEFGLRLRRSGCSIYMDATLWRRFAPAMGHPVQPMRPRFGLGPASVRRYYRLRNMIHILREYGTPGAAARVAALGLLKPAANLPLAPSLAFRHLRLAARAVVDAYAGRLGVAPGRWSTENPSGH
jgi:glycosyltransferase involved in cell wall biosynthesis